MNTRGKVFIQGAFAHRATGNIFRDRGFEIVKDIEDADITVWTGGEDINPAIYGQEKLPCTWFSSERDKEDAAAVELSKGKFKVGICRGAQLLNCIDNAGTLWQDINNHGSSHLTIDSRTGARYLTNSIHHQGIRLTDKAILLAHTTVSTFKKDDKIYWKFVPGDDDNDELDVEAAYYPDTYSYLFQGHPEFGGADTTSLFFKYFDEFYQNWYENHRLKEVA